MELSSFVRSMAALKNEFSSILPKSTNAKTSLSKTNQVFMILTLIKLEIEFDSIQKQILTGSTIPSFDDVFAQLLRHSSITTQSQLSEVTLDTLVMLSQSHPRSDSRSVYGGNRDMGQHPQCTYCNHVGHT